MNSKLILTSLMAMSFGMRMFLNVSDGKNYKLINKTKPIFNLYY